MVPEPVMVAFDISVELPDTFAPFCTVAFTKVAPVTVAPVVTVLLILV